MGPRCGMDGCRKSSCTGIRFPERTARVAIWHTHLLMTTVSSGMTCVFRVLEVTSIVFGKHSYVLCSLRYEIRHQFVYVLCVAARETETAGVSARSHIATDAGEGTAICGSPSE